MSFRKVSASRIFDGFRFLEQDSVVVFNHRGVVDSIINKSDAGDDIEWFDDILVPGLVNCHCHLELSHMKDMVPPRTRLIDFLLAVIKKRGVEEEKIFASIEKAEKELFDNGTMAVADICNTAQTLAVKQKSFLYWHNLIEVINLNDSAVENVLMRFHQVLKEFRPNKQAGFSSALTPHAPYSVSPATHRAINNATAGEIISIHNQESEAENELFQTGAGDFLRLYQGLGYLQPPILKSGKTSLQTYLPFFTQKQTVILVHNTFITEADILFARAHADKYSLELVYCLCPNANLYIENTLPPVDLLLKQGCSIVLGTDSYGSNWQLNIAAEVKTLLENFSILRLEEVLSWATANGAKALRCNDMLGSFEKGKKPGLVLLETGPSKDALTGKSKRII